MRVVERYGQVLVVRVMMKLMGECSGLPSTAKEHLGGKVFRASFYRGLNGGNMSPVKGDPSLFEKGVSSRLTNPFGHTSGTNRYTSSSNIGS